MSILRANTIIDAAGTGAPHFSNGASISGIVTATSFSGSGANLTGVSAQSATTAQGLTGTPDISVGTVSATGSITGHNFNSTGVSTTTSLTASTAGITTLTNTTTINTTGSGDISISPGGTGIVRTSATASTPTAIGNDTAWSISESNVYTFAGGILRFPSDPVAGQTGIIYITGNVTAWGTASQWHFPGGTLPTGADSKTNSVIPYYVHSTTAIKLGSITGEIS